MPTEGFTGISYPFRINTQGGVVLSTTSSEDTTHIDESIRQILGTNYLERVMEPEIYSSIEDYLFEPGNEHTQELLKQQIVSDLERLEDRIKVDTSDIEVNLVSEDFGEAVYVNITYLVIKYEAYYTTIVKVGET